MERLFLGVLKITAWINVVLVYMKRKMLIGFTLVLCLMVFSFSVAALADDSNEVPAALQEGEDSPGVHQCPRDNYDDNTGPTNREGFGDNY